MITIIDKNGEEFVYGEDRSLPVPAGYGVHDKLVSCYRNGVWIVCRLSALLPGDFFRNFDERPESDRVFFITKKPRVHNHIPRGWEVPDPDIFLQGVEVRRLQQAYEANPQRIGRLTSPNRLLLTDES